MLEKFDRDEKLMLIVASLPAIGGILIGLYYLTKWLFSTYNFGFKW